ncbi:copper homeostasis protein CutC [Acidicapsa dinghuensis]|uniref:PF03932 family protein CutC n=1 Tax=Acidicapsa dinghuensis TaxID=2218256 RepID=A0ABW1E945_9BACT|nr:copper homeostasis protein CutC [Acidicapsa dinghuensis]
MAKIDWKLFNFRALWRTKPGAMGTVQPEVRNFLLDGVMWKLEICVDSVEAAKAAEAGGAQRVELCSALSEGGLTPSMGLIRAVRESVGIEVQVMIRPRGGDFCYSGEEIAVMRADIEAAREAGADGVVLGLLTPDGDVDVEPTRMLVEVAHQAAPPIEVTFHRALDMTQNMQAALEDVIHCGADRVLTSGGAPNAMLGLDCMAGLIKTARERIAVMVCGCVRPHNVSKIVEATGALEFHASLRRSVPGPVRFRKPELKISGAGDEDYARCVLRTSDVQQLREAIERTFAETLRIDRG